MFGNKSIFDTDSALIGITIHENG